MGDIQSGMALDNTFSSIALATLWVCIFLSCCNQATAQQQDAFAPASAVGPSTVAVMSELPDAPGMALGQQTSSTQPSQEDSGEGKQTKRILGIVPNFRSVSANIHLPAQNPREKFIGFAQDSFDYSSFTLVSLLSGVSLLQGSVPEFHTGVPAYARYYWHTFADQTDENLWVDFLLPVAFHQDPRFYTMGSGTADHPNGSAKRLGYAFSRILITRTDSGGSNFNFSEIVGAGAASGISNLYYPSSQRNWTKTGQRWALSVGVDSGARMFKEFWPEINHAIFHRK